MTDYAIHQLFITELEKHLELLKTAVSALSKNPDNSQAHTDLIRAVHSIKGSAKLVRFIKVAELFSSLEGIAQEIGKKSLPLNDETASLFQSAAGVMQQAAETPPQDLEGVIESLGGEIKPLIDLAHEITSSKSAGSSERGFETAREEADIFLERLRKISGILDEGIQRINKNFEDKEALGQLADISEKIKESGAIIHLPIVAKVGEALSTCFCAAREGHLLWTRGHSDLILEAVDFLSRIGKVPKKEMEQWLERHEKNIDSIASVLLAISSEESLPSQEIKMPSPQKAGMPEVCEEEDTSLLEIFKIELSTHLQSLNESLVKLEQKPDDAELLERLMRAAHSIKGAARIVDLNIVSRLAHVVEDYFISIQKGERTITQEAVTALLKGFDLLARLMDVSPGSLARFSASLQSEIDKAVDEISGLATKDAPEEPPVQPSAAKALLEKRPSRPLSDRYLRVSAQNLNRLMGLAGEALIESRWLKPFCESLDDFKRGQADVGSLLDKVIEVLRRDHVSEEAFEYLSQTKKEILSGARKLNSYLADLELFMRRIGSLSDRLYGEVIASRMRPLGDGIEHFPRLVRDLATDLNKKAKLHVIGERTPVDREILEKLEAPLSHLLRNAVDHGIEPPQERLAKGKPPAGTVTLEAAHKGGSLIITVSDDGRGVDLEQLRRRIIEKNFVSEAMAAKLEDSELLEFIFLPGFSTSEAVTEISGRGVGLNVVQSMAHEVGGTVKVYLNGGLVVQLQLPLTLSVLRCLLVEINKEPYAFPLARIERVEMIDSTDVQFIENRQYISLEEKNIGLIPAHQAFDLPEPENRSDLLPVVVVGDQKNSYGIVVDGYLGEKELVLHELDPLLGKVPDISAGAFMEDGSPVLIVDVEDLARSVDKLLSKGFVGKMDFHASKPAAPHRRKKVLVVDDSITVREVESRLLENLGYEVDSAVNGMDGWNAVRMGSYDLVITDVDMPRMNGIDFVKAVRSDPKLKDLPIMIVSYKEREQDRIDGLEAGANYYLTKSSFHDETLIAAVEDLIGKALESV